MKSLVSFACVLAALSLSGCGGSDPSLESNEATTPVVEADMAIGVPSEAEANENAAAQDPQVAVKNPNQFDLICSGESEDIKKNTKESFEQRISVDLDQALYCEQGCNSPSAIAAVDESTIYFENDPGKLYGAETYEKAVNRATGHYWFMLMNSNYGVTEVGSCEKTEFTPMPEKKF
jgi:uncharacterized protein YcfL